MNLREEIESRVRFFNHTDRNNKYTSCTDEIIKLFEKRIDILFREMLEAVSKDMVSNEMNYVEARFLSFYEKRKKELLK